MRKSIQYEKIKVSNKKIQTNLPKGLLNKKEIIEISNKESEV